MRIATFFISGLFLCLASAATAESPTSELDSRAYEMYQQVFSPFCPGRSLNDCPSSKAHELKTEMRTKLEQGVPQEEILAEVFQRFGDKYRAVPQYEGFGKLVWWAPLGFLVAGLLVAVGVILGRKRSGSGVIASSGEAQRKPKVSPEMSARIEKELSSFD